MPDTYVDIGYSLRDAVPSIPIEEIKIDRERRNAYAARALIDIIASNAHTASYLDAGTELFIHRSIRSRRRARREQGVHAQFQALAQKWREETAVLSSITDIVLNFNYQRIIGIGPRAVPLIIDDMKRNGGHWFWALQAITGVDPIPETDRGDRRKMISAWLIWWDNNKVNWVR